MLDIKMYVTDSSNTFAQSTEMELPAKEVSEMENLVHRNYICVPSISENSSHRNTVETTSGSQDMNTGCNKFTSNPTVASPSEQQATKSQCTSITSSDYENDASSYFSSRNMTSRANNTDHTKRLVTSQTQTVGSAPPLVPHTSTCTNYRKAFISSDGTLIHDLPVDIQLEPFQLTQPNILASSHLLQLLHTTRVANYLATAQAVEAWNDLLYFFDGDAHTIPQVTMPVVNVISTESKMHFNKTRSILVGTGPSGVHTTPSNTSTVDSELVATIMQTHETPIFNNLVDVSIANVSAQALVDTGAVANCVSTAFFNDLLQHSPLEIDTQKARTLRDASGNQLQVHGAVTLPLQIEGFHTTVLCQVVDKLPRPLFLGLPFFKDHNVHLDFQD